jgi:multiple sugar transport system ATP-binding protein
MRGELRLLFRRIEGTVVYVTHDQAEAMTLSDRLVVMKDGLVQQAGTPLDVYNHPMNMFVARFLGSPSMNFVQGTVGSENGTPVLQTAGGPLPIPAELASGNGITTGRTLAIGIRPEDIAIAHGAGNGLQATIEVIEPMGSLNVVYARLGKERVAVTTEPTFFGAFGDAVSLRFAEEKTHLFDVETEGVVGPA